MIKRIWFSLWMRWLKHIIDIIRSYKTDNHPLQLMTPSHHYDLPLNILNLPTKGPLCFQVPSEESRLQTLDRQFFLKCKISYKYLKDTNKHIRPWIGWAFETKVRVKEKLLILHYPWMQNNSKVNWQCVEHDEDQNHLSLHHNHQHLSLHDKPSPPHSILNLTLN